MSSLLDTLKSQITPDMIQNIATSLGESGTGVQSALTTSGVAMLASLAGQANNTSMLGQVMNLIKGVGTSAMGALYLLAALCVFTCTLAPLAATAALRITLE